MVTGDTAATALEIGKQIGVFEDEPENIGADGSLTSLDQQMITGEQWEALSDEEPQYPHGGTPARRQEHPDG